MAAKLLKSAVVALTAMALLAGPALAVPEQEADDTFWLWQAAKNYFGVILPDFGTQDDSVLRPAHADDGKGVKEVDPPHDGPCPFEKDHLCTG